MHPYEPTSSFGLSRYLMSVEGPSATLGLLVSMLYDNPQLRHTDWNVSHTAASRPEFVRQLRAAGSEKRRLAMSVHTDEAVEVIRKQADRLHLVSHCLTTNADRHKAAR